MKTAFVITITLVATVARAQAYPEVDPADFDDFAAIYPWPDQPVALPQCHGWCIDLDVWCEYRDECKDNGCANDCAGMYDRCRDFCAAAWDPDSLSLSSETEQILADDASDFSGFADEYEDPGVLVSISVYYGFCDELGAWCTTAQGCGPDKPECASDCEQMVQACGVWASTVWDDKVVALSLELREVIICNPDNFSDFDAEFAARQSGTTTATSECFGWCNDLKDWCERIRECSNLGGQASLECYTGCWNLGDRCKDKCVSRFRMNTPWPPPQG